MFPIKDISYGAIWGRLGANLSGLRGPRLGQGDAGRGRPVCLGEGLSLRPEEPVLPPHSEGPTETVEGRAREPPPGPREVLPRLDAAEETRLHPADTNRLRSCSSFRPE